MSRTPEQVAADDALTAAIEKWLQAYDPDDEPRILGEYVVHARIRVFDEDGDALTHHALIPRDGYVPTDLMLGMTEYAATLLRNRITED